MEVAVAVLHAAVHPRRDIVVDHAIHGLAAASCMPGAGFAFVPGAGRMLPPVVHDAVGAAIRAVA